MSKALVDGAVFANRYRVVRCIATGGMGAVYEVIHLGTNRPRALKVMHSHLFHSAEWRERFKREARVAAEIKSEYVVDVFDTGVDEATGIPFLVMELLQGEDLRQRIERMGRLPPSEVVTYLLQVAAALDKSHAATIVHRDLKPENIFLTHREDGLPLVKVLDFGVAKILAENTTKLQETQGLGTPLFMPPEQLGEAGIVTSVADIHALGMVAYMLLVGKTYWFREVQKGNPYHFIVVASQGVRESAVTRAAEQGVVLPASFDAWFAKMTALRPVERFQHAGEAIAALEKVLGVEYDGPRPQNVVGPAVVLPLASPNEVVAMAATHYQDPQSLTNTVGLTTALTMGGLPKSSRSGLRTGIVAVTLCAVGGAIAGWMFLRPTHAPVVIVGAPLPNDSATTLVTLPAAPIESTSSAALTEPRIETTPSASKTLPKTASAAPAPRATSKTKTTTSKPKLDDLLGQH